jgi:hypothetical protein
MLRQPGSSRVEIASCGGGAGIQGISGKLTTVHAMRADRDICVSHLGGPEVGRAGGCYAGVPGRSSLSAIGCNALLGRGIPMAAKEDANDGIVT